MKKKIIMLIASVLLVAVSITAFAACGETGNNAGSNEQNAPTITFTEDMTADDVLSVLSTVKNFTAECRMEERGEEVTCIMSVSAQGYIQQYVYPKEGTIEYLEFMHNNSLVGMAVYPQLKDGSKRIIELSDEQVQEYTKKLEEYFELRVNEIRDKLNEENGCEWEIQNGQLIFKNESFGNVGNTIIYKDFNSSKLDFDYYMSLDIPERE